MEIKGAAEQMNHEERPENAKHFFPKWTPYAKEEQLALINQLNSINITINRLGREVKNERSLIEDLKLQIGQLKTEVPKTVIDNKDVENNLK
ncbi:hypothetical protein JHK82_052432 [Glycine max]|nr:hypothetical protein JHK86_052273 [Glycine max]KAG4926641.1 hypothetical protein JHK85_053127 [Glycine max]KAG5082274.1 hypothetical protein JHK84_052312 [Glycine max]KAG5085035.1 hypothetical protein JHK82_052432 [Glycine max]